MSADITPKKARGASDELLVLWLNQYRSDSGSYIVIKAEMDRRINAPKTRREWARIAVDFAKFIVGIPTALYFLYLLARILGLL